jgi:NADH-quinone oxidoreductase subunit E
VFSSELRAKATELVGRYPVPRSALLPLLHLVQAQDGYLSDDGVAECAELLGLSRAEVGAVATFYTMYKREPLGRHLVSVCTNFSCKVRGGEAVYQALADKLEVGHNQTTSDGAFTLEHVECLGNCEGAPVVTVDYYNYECLGPDQACELVDSLAAGEVPAPTRGVAPPGVREVEHRLAGLGPPRTDAPGAAPSQARGDDGAVVMPEAGPGVPFVPVEPEFSEEAERERAAAKARVREAGREPRQVEQEGGPQAREFPTRDPDWEPPEPGQGRRTPSGPAEADRGADDRSDDGGEERGDG